MNQFDEHDNQPGQFESQVQVQQLASKTLTDSDLDVVRNSLQILTELTDQAQDLSDLQGELPHEIKQTCVMMRKKLAKIVEAKSMYANFVEEGAENAADESQTIEQITIYLEMIDLIDHGLKQYNNTC